MFFSGLLHTRTFEMNHLHMDLASAGDVNGLLQRCHHAIGFIAQMGEVGALVLLDQLGQLQHFIGLGIGAGRGEQTAGQAQSPGLQALLQQVQHVGHFSFGGRALCHAHGHQTQGVVAHQHARIHRCGWEAVEIFAKAHFSKRQPGCAGVEVVGQQFDFAGQAWGHRKAAMANDFRGHTLAQFAFGFGVDRQGEVRVGFDVNESRGHHQSAGVDHPLG